jgi:uncharacterized protein (DUF2336 family)
MSLRIPADEAARVRRGADPRSDSDVLVGLAHDASVTVRAALALNTAAPTEANGVLAHDRDERVRILLARKLAALLPELSPVDHALLYRETWDTLRALAADEASRVRAIIADAVKELPEAPHGLIRRLAGDIETSVCDPVIRLSPLLTAQDLVALVAAAPSVGTILAIARRADLDAAVSDAIAQTSNAAAILALLSNRSAQIREATLDALVARSVEYPDWHEPLVRRPALPPRSARMLSEIVAACLLSELAARADLAPDLAQELRRRVAMRLTPPEPQAATPEVTAEAALAQGQAMAARGELTEQVLLEAAQRGEVRVSAALLAVAAGTPVSVVDRASSLRSAKGLISLVWKAGFTMRVAVALQTLLARLSPDAVLMAGPGGCFPLAVEEMRWQLEFLARMGT